MIRETFRLRIAQLHFIAHMPDNMSVTRTLQRVKQFIPPLSPEMHKGQAGRVAVVGGSEEYTSYQLHD
jgi:NAD(P)H-hydrate repair Nnr-like enzyme with NAD(P)H-hydrate dehydratase domain